MALEKQFVDLQLTEEQFRKFSKTILGEHYKDEKTQKALRRQEFMRANTRYYGIKDIMELCDNQMINDETIAKTIHNIQPDEYELRRRKERKQAKILGYGMLAGLCLSFGLIILGAAQKRGLDEKYLKAYREALILADTNKDGVADKAERETLMYELIKGKNIIYNPPREPEHLDGRSISKEELTEWLENYVYVRQRRH